MLTSTYITDFNCTQSTVLCRNKMYENHRQSNTLNQKDQPHICDFDRYIFNPSFIHYFSSIQQFVQL